MSARSTTRKGRVAVVLLSLVALSAAADFTTGAASPDVAATDPYDVTSSLPAAPAAKKPHVRIIGGQPADNPVSAYPWMVSLRMTFQGVNGILRCGGSLISPTAVLTAAHCLYPAPAPVESIVALIGWRSVVLWGGASASSLPAESGAELISAANWTVHPGFNTSAVLHDIAVVRLSRPSAKQPVALDLRAGSGLTVPGNAVIALGYGIVGEGSCQSAMDAGADSATQLYRAVFPAVNDIQCGWFFGGQYRGDLQLCAGNNTGAVDTCNGDSGGPLVAAVAGLADRWAAGAQVGITSFGRAGAPLGVYTRVSSYAQWVRGLAPDILDAAAAQPPAQGAAQRLLPGPGAEVCGEAWSNASAASPGAILDCGAFAVASVSYAYFGNPSGSCWGGTAARGGCDGGAAAQAAVAAACVGRSFCSVAPRTLSAPCLGNSSKRLLVRAVCSSAPAAGGAPVQAQQPLGQGDQAGQAPPACSPSKIQGAISCVFDVTGLSAVTAAQSGQIRAGAAAFLALPSSAVAVQGTSAAAGAAAAGRRALRAAAAAASAVTVRLTVEGNGFATANAALRLASAAASSASGGGAAGELAAALRSAGLASAAAVARLSFALDLTCPPAAAPEGWGVDGKMSRAALIAVAAGAGGGGCILCVALAFAARAFLHRRTEPMYVSESQTPQGHEGRQKG